MRPPAAGDGRDPEGEGQLQIQPGPQSLAELPALLQGLDPHLLLDPLPLGVGGLYAFNFVPDEIEPIYGGDPNGAMGFVRIKIQ